MIFRYPGGKTRLVPVLSEYIQNYMHDGGAFHDVFVGGGSVLIHAAQIYPKSPLFANDKDPWMFAFWSVLVGKSSEFDELVSRVSKSPTISMFKAMRLEKPTSRVDRAYYAVFFNRTTFSGMAGSGPIGGYEQKSEWKIGCRYNAERLCEELREWRSMLRGRLSVSQDDGAAYARRTRSFMYLDPPYYKQGPALYESSMGAEDHRALSAALRGKGRWVLSYDNCPEVQRLYAWANRVEIPARYSMRGKKYDWKSDKEMVITPDAVDAPWQLGLL